MQVIDYGRMKRLEVVQPVKRDGIPLTFANAFCAMLICLGVVVLYTRFKTRSKRKLRRI